MKKETKVVFVSAAALAVIFFSAYFISNRKNAIRINSVEYKEDKSLLNSQNLNSETNAGKEEGAKKIPEKYLLSVPFASQAPLGDWSEPYQNACEEASLIMAKRYIDHKTLSKVEMKTEIDQSVAWQLENWKKHEDLDAQETLTLAKQYFNLDGKIISGYGVDNIKKYVATGTPVLVPAAGRKLGNPNFTGAGPEYHMLVIIGYDDTKGVFITNDPGTRKGEKYIYKYQTLINAISGPHENMAKELIVLIAN